ncbi:OmpA family protein [Pontibacter sp. JH31]|uniref:OmpA family protein n=1 Tax=Pontibacter aquaedesilientis TaxID=2766980 RepID=A0ABR7XI66_9BACT|nr:OmpA family protein [Pontibacter aquaedesilientis]MBD1397333.1 OmpA family protein [Pontibacter aquaedesilientis]
MLLVTGLAWPEASQAQKKEVKLAEKYFNNFEYALALEAYKKAMEQTEPNAHMLQRIADSYRLMNNSKEAEFWYAQVASFPDASPASIYYYAEAAKRNGDYAKAKELYQRYGNLVPEKADMAKSLAASCDTAMLWISRPLSYKIAAEEKLNSTSADFSPIQMPAGALIFSSDRLSAEGKKKQSQFNWTGNGFVQLYLAATASDSTWSVPVPLSKEVNTDYHNGPASFLELEDMLFFTRTNSMKRGRTKTNTDPTSWVGGAGKGGDYINRLEIYMAKRQDGAWADAVPFAYNKPKEYSVGHPAVTPDGKLLYFVSDMPGGMGETDIYYCERLEDGSWGKPVNAGPAINTSGRESFPAIGGDGHLYFSSDGHLGLGGLDIFKAEGKRSEWTSVKNMMYPLNSSRDDLGMVVDKAGVKGWLSSGRESATGSDNIYSFKKVPVECMLVGQTIEMVAQPGTHIKKKVVVDNVLLQLFEENIGSLDETHSDAVGGFGYKVQAGMQYTIRGSKKGYLTQTVLFTPDCRFSIDSLLVEMVLYRDTPNVPIVLENIFYDLDKHDIRPDAALELDKLVRVLKENPTIRIELSSHTDSRQTRKYNQDLSERRAQAAVDYIISKGIDRKRLVAKGYGESRLRNKCSDYVECSEEDHQVNRRTEFKIISK